MRLTLYQVDAFTGKLFSGNPAAVCPLEQWLPVELMRNIARENNLSETAFVVPEGNDFWIRWFTPSVEVDLCGHATLASGHVYFHHRQFPGNEIRFHSRSGLLRVRRQNDLLTLDFPADPATKIELFPELTAGFNIKPKEGYRGKTDFLLVYEDESQIADLAPDFRAIAKVDARGVIVTARGRSVDFVSRFFGPQSGVDEDPVTGSAHTTLTPYWSTVLGKKELTAMQLSSRRGSLQCKYLGDRVEISGKAMTYLIGEIDV
ncbi:MAG TPA: PhzF family phenazine biosynthesis protein [Spirochaetia bacterium]|nr:PhzF family phenazine biosynthesis protein [Spirochaetia bacterium]